MPTSLLVAIKCFPFLTASAAASPAGKLNFSRLIEAFIIAGITMFGTQQVMSAKIDHLEKMVEKISTTAEDARRVQLEIVPMRNLQIKTLQELCEKLEGRIAKLEQKK